MTGALGRMKRRAVDRLRGQLNADHLVEQGLQLGHRAFIASNAYLDPGYPWLIEIGEEATIGPRVIILAHDASMQRHIHRTLLAPVVIGRRAFIGASSIVLAGSRVGENTVIGAGSVVRGEIPAGVVAVGNPARVVTDLESMIQRHRKSATPDSPSWPHEGWTAVRGITPERRRQQRDALPPGVTGYVEWPDRVLADEEQEL